MQDAVGPSVGSSAIPASLLGTLKSAAVFVLDLLVDQIKQWHNNKHVAAALREFETQTEWQIHRLEGLEAQLASRNDSVDISEPIGAL